MTKVKMKLILKYVILQKIKKKTYNKSNNEIR